MRVQHSIDFVAGDSVLLGNEQHFFLSVGVDTADSGSATSGWDSSAEEARPQRSPVVRNDLGKENGHG